MQEPIPPSPADPTSGPPRLAGETLGALARSAPIAMLVTTRTEGRIVEANDACADLLGYARDELLGRTGDDLGLWVEPAQRLAIRGALAAGEPLHDAEVALRDKAGAVRYVLVNASAIDVDGTPMALGYIVDASGRRRLESELVTSEARLRLALDNAAMGIWDWDVAARRVTWSEHMGPIYGLPRGTPGLDADAFFALVHPDDRATVRAMDRNAVERRRPYELEFRIVLPDGSVRWLEARARPVAVDDWGHPARFLGVTIDITARKEAETERERREREARALLAAAERRARELALLERARAAMASELDLPALFRTVVEAVAETYGYSQVSLYLIEGDELVMQHQVGYAHFLERLPIAGGVMGRVARSGEPALLEDVTTDPDFIAAVPGIQSEVCVPLQVGGAVVGVLNVETTNAARLDAADLGLMRALSEHIAVAIRRARLHDTVRHSEERLRTALSAAQMATWDWDVPGGRVVRSREMPALYGEPPGAPPEEVDAYLPRIHPDDLAPVNEADLRLREGDAAAYAVEYRVVHPGGEVRWLRDQGEAVRFAAGKPVRVLGVTMDVTERKRAELALAAERDLLTTLMDHLPHAVYVKDAASRFLRLNPVAARHLGLRDASEALGKTDFDFVPFALARQYFADEQRVIRTGQPLLNRLEPQDEGDPPRIWWLTSTVPLRDADGTVIGLVGSGHDVSERIRLEDALREARDAAEAASRAKSDFLSAMSHEFRTPMNAIIGYAHLLLEGLDGPLLPAQAADVDRISQAADRLLGLIDNVLDLARLEAGRLHLSPQQLDLVGVLREVCEDARAEARRKGIALSLELPPALPPAPADPERLRQIFRGLIGNALKFTEGGRIMVRGRAVAGTVEVSIADTGIGIDPEFAPFVFDPFLQGESGGARRFGGPGLGLAIAQRLIDLHGGGIDVQSAPGEGTVVTVRLPALFPSDAGSRLPPSPAD